MIITAVVVEGRSKSEVARDYGFSRYWVQQLVQRYEREGPIAFQPRSRRPHSTPHAVDAETEEMIIRLRKELCPSKAGRRRGNHRRAQGPLRAGGIGPAGASGLHDLADLDSAGFVSPQPQKRPRSSWRTFCAEQPNERWQADITHWQLADGSEVSMLNIIDDTPGYVWEATPAGPPPCWLEALGEDRARRLPTRSPSSRRCEVGARSSQ